MNLSLTQAQDVLFEVARGIRSDGTEVMPLAFLLKSGHITPVPLGHLPNKDVWATFLRDVVKHTDPDAIVFHVEAWFTTGDATTLAIHQAGVPIKEMPGAFEVLTSVMETRSGETRSLVSKILPDGSAGPAEVGPQVLESTGRMVGLYPRISSRGEA